MHLSARQSDDDVLTLRHTTGTAARVYNVAEDGHARLVPDLNGFAHLHSAALHGGGGGSAHQPI